MDRAKGGNIELLGDAATPPVADIPAANADSGPGRGMAADFTGNLKLLEASLEIIPHGLIIVSDDDHPVLWNRRFLDLIGGHGAHPPVGASFCDILSALQANGWHRLETGNGNGAGVGAAAGGTEGDMPVGEAFRAAGGLVLQSPDQRVLDVRQTPLPGARAVLLTDITAEVRERRRADRASALLADSLDVVGDGLLIFDANDRLVLMNERFRQIAEPPDSVDLGMTFEAFVRVFAAELKYRIFDNDPVDNTEAMVQRRLALHRNAPSVHEQRHGNGRWVLVTTRATAEGGRVITYADITGRKHQEEELLQAKEQAEQAYESLRQSQSSLMELDKLASLAGLVAGIAHELNTPVGISLTAISLLREKQAAFEAKLESAVLKRSDLANYVTSVSDAVRLTNSNLQRAAELIRSFKQVTVDQASAERRQFDLETYLDEIIVSLTPKLKKVHHTVSVSCPAGVRMDSYPGAFAQVITNLIMNSLLHGFDDGRVGTISIDVEDRGASGVCIVYRDNGKGMSEQVRRHIFEAFFTTKRNQGGSGLGMSIVHNLITQTLGGDVAVDSAPGWGTCFTITLPLSPPIPAAAQ